jgi:hypothetical protein
MCFSGEASEKSNFGKGDTILGYRPLFSRLSDGIGKVISE